MPVQRLTEVNKGFEFTREKHTSQVDPQVMHTVALAEVISAEIKKGIQVWFKFRRLSADGKTSIILVYSPVL